MLCRLPKVLRRPVSQFVCDARGNVAVWFALLLLPMLGFSFGAVKFAEMARYRSDLVDALDAAALAVARRTDQLNIDPCDLAKGTDGTVSLQAERDALVEYGREFFSRNFPASVSLFADEDLTKPFDAGQHLDFNITCSVVVPYAQAFLDMGPILNTYFDTPALKIGTATEVSLPGSGRIELALVLDVTGSMNECATVSGGSCSGSGTRIAVLKDAVEQMMDTLYGANDDATNEFVRVGIVPFSSTVNINPDHFYYDGGGNPTALGREWMDTEAGSVWHGANFMHMEYSETDPDSGNWFQIDPDRKVNHFDLFDSINVLHAKWKGCVEARPFPLDETDDEPGSSFSQSDYVAARTKPADLNVPSDTPTAVQTRINQAWNQIPAKSDSYTFGELAEPDSTRFVPWFNPDEPDCYFNACGGYDSLSGWQRDFHVSGTGSAQDFPAWMIDGPKSNENHYESEYSNRYFVHDYTYLNVRNGEPFSSRVYRNLMMHYRHVYSQNFHVSGDSYASDGSTNCGQDRFSFGYNPLNAHGMVAMIERFRAWNCLSREYRIRQAYPGVWDPVTETYQGKYDRADGYSSSSDGTSSREIALQGPNYQCSTPLLPLTTSKRAVLDKIESLVPGGSTNTAIGAIWGWRLLSAAAPFTEGSDPTTSEGRRWRKFMVLMTDGQNNLSAAVTHNLSDYSPYGYADQNRLNLLGPSDWNPYDIDDKYEDELDNKTIRVCHRARASGVKVFAIGFAIQSGSGIEKALQACAIEEDAYFRAENAEALHDAFGKITDQIVELHVSG
jgi:hypothetical protein